MIGGVGFLILVLIVCVFATIYFWGEREASKPDPTESDEYRELQQENEVLRLAVGNIKEIAQTFSDTNAEGGILADLILREIPSNERKELKPHG